MLDLLHRTNGSGLAERTAPTYAPEYSPPEHRPPVTPPTAAPWPRNAKATVATLLVAAVLGALGTIIGFATGDDQTAAERESQATIETLTTERNALVSQVTDFQSDLDATVAERDAIATELAALEVTSDAIVGQRDDLVDALAALELTNADVVAVRDDLVDELAVLESSSAAVIAERDELVAQLTELDATIAALTTQRNDLVGDVTQLEADLTAQTLLTTRVVNERNALANLFPIRFDAVIDADDIVGTYDLDYTQAYCSGFTSCGTVPMLDEITIRTTTDDRLEMVMADNPAAGMMMVDGVLYAVFDSTNLTTACSGTPRLARVTVTVFPHGLTVANDATPQVVDYGASMTVQAPATAGCPAGLAFYAAQLTPQA